MACPALPELSALLRWVAAAVVAVPLAASPTARAQGQGLAFPGDGVICDQTTRICYDRYGVSYPLTRREFGARAEQNLRRQFSGRPWPTELIFSSGELCELQRQICWDDGWQRRNVSQRLSRQLFGSSWNPNTGTSGNGNGASPRPGQQLSRCELSQRGQQLFRGDCSLRRRTMGSGPAYVVELGDGRRYAFRNRQGQLVLNDAANLWPAQFYSRGSDVIFRWADLQLVARPAYDDGDGPNRRPQPWSQTPTNQFLLDLFNNLFR